VEQDALATHVHGCVGGAKVDPHVAREVARQSSPELHVGKYSLQGGVKMAAPALALQPADAQDINYPHSLYLAPAAHRRK
jgi:hypothetical protein